MVVRCLFPLFSFPFSSLRHPRRRNHPDTRHNRHLLLLLHLLFLLLPSASPTPLLPRLLPTPLPTPILSYATLSTGHLCLDPPPPYLSGEESLAVTHGELRRRGDFIVVGRGTVEEDDPVLVPHEVSIGAVGEGDCSDVDGTSTSTPSTSSLSSSLSSPSALSPVILSRSLALSRPYSSLRLGKKHSGAVIITSPTSRLLKRCISSLSSLPFLSSALSSTNNFYDEGRTPSVLVHSERGIRIYEERTNDKYRYMITTSSSSPHSVVKALNALHSLSSSSLPVIIVEGGPAVLREFARVGAYGAVLTTVSPGLPKEGGRVERVTVFGREEEGEPVELKCGVDVMRAVVAKTGD